MAGQDVTRLRRAVTGTLTVVATAAAAVCGAGGTASAHAYGDHLVKGEYLRA
ncbi:hypothetical protein [Streptomyces sp. NPDC051636]|uniref:hypothetical protein n=1 Tax=Streptomyces sp. NPDC051636 TaxID=3365663 RepID=UPI0037964113